jgi:type IV fimbrial biogenesis protein FimT
MRYSKGFTLIELMIVIAIVAILTTLAAPSFRSLIQSNTMSSAVNTFMADMRFARSESIRRGGGVVMCRSDAPEAPTPVCRTTTGTNGWVSGWIIYIDQNNNGTIQPNELLRVQSPITSIDSIMQRSPATARNKLAFTATGRLTMSAALTLQFGGNPTFSNESQRVVCVSVGGRARVAGDGYASCT